MEKLLIMDTATLSVFMKWVIGTAALGYLEITAVKH